MRVDVVTENIKAKFATGVDAALGGELEGHEAVVLTVEGFLKSKGDTGSSSAYATFGPMLASMAQAWIAAGFGAPPKPPPEMVEPEPLITPETVQADLSSLFEAALYAGMPRDALREAITRALAEFP